jgi:Lipase (class 3)
MVFDRIVRKCTFRVMSLIILSSTLNYSAHTKEVRNFGASLCSEEVDTKGNSNNNWHKPPNLTKLKHAFTKALDVYSPIYAKKVNTILEPISKSSYKAIPLGLLEDMATAAELSSAVYTKITDGHALSIGADDKPDCIAQYDEQSETLWIISRGTKTTEDVLTDSSWFAKTEKIGQLNIPVGVVRKCESIIPNLMEHLDVLAIRKNKVKRIYFAGHSLGGAVSVALYLSWNLNKIGSKSGRTDVETAAITFGSPLVISNPPDGFCIPSSSSSSSSSRVKGSVGSELAKNVHNVVYQLDIVPRFLGPHPLPTNLLEDSLGDLVNQLLSRKSTRGTYRSYGNFYTVRDAKITWVEKLARERNKNRLEGEIMNRIEGEKSNYLIGIVDNPDDFLSSFPDTARDLLYGLNRDHCSIATAESFRAILTKIKKDK